MKFKSKLLFCLSVFGLTLFANAQNNRPNIIFILTDDLGYGDISALNKESKIKTPNVDQLFYEGISFSDAHTAASVCTPSRYALLTGRYPWRTKKKKGVLGPYDPPIIEKKRLTIAKMLKEKGYHTACIGKWHLGWDWQRKNGMPADIAKEKQIDFSRPILNGPTTRGFDYYFGTDVPNYPPYTFIENDKVAQVPDMQKPAEMFGRAGLMTAGWELENILPTLGDKAVTYINEKGKTKRPFFLYLPLTSPHEPVAPSDKFKNTSKAGPYGDFIQETDWIVGRVMKAVDDAGIKENTLIIFSSDNGSPERDGENMFGTPVLAEKYNHDPSAGLRGTKGTIYEGGHHVPFIARWPAVIKKSLVSQIPICLVDMIATAADITQSKLTDEDAVDSYSLLPILEGKPAGYKRDFVVHYSSDGLFAIRKNEWKLIMSKEVGQDVKNKLVTKEKKPSLQLFNMSKDPAETKNVYNAHPEVVKQLSKELKNCIDNGRSTLGKKQQNDGTFLPGSVEWMRN